MSKHINFHVLTLFPDQIRQFVETSITGRAVEKGIIGLDTVYIRDFAHNHYGKIDDTMYGGGTGLLIMCDPVFDAYKSVCEKAKTKPHTIYMSPKGKVLDQAKVIELSKYEDLIIICGHYEGIDQRVIDEICDEEISIGDYVLTGGEAASIIVIDSVSRMIDGVLPNEEAYTNESHMNGTLEAPQYTKPPVWHGREVPKVLASGNMAAIDEYYLVKSLKETMQKRPDMFDKLKIPEDIWQKVLADPDTL